MLLFSFSPQVCVEECGGNCNLDGLIDLEKEWSLLLIVVMIYVVRDK